MLKKLDGNVDRGIGRTVHAITKYTKIRLLAAGPKVLLLKAIDIRLDLFKF